MLLVNLPAARGRIEFGRIGECIRACRVSVRFLEDLGTLSRRRSQPSVQRATTIVAIEPKQGERPGVFSLPFGFETLARTLETVAGDKEKYTAAIVWGWCLWARERCAPKKASGSRSETQKALVPLMVRSVLTLSTDLCRPLQNAAKLYSLSQYKGPNPVHQMTRSLSKSISRFNPPMWQKRTPPALALRLLTTTRVAFCAAILSRLARCLSINRDDIPTDVAVSPGPQKSIGKRGQTTCSEPKSSTAEAGTVSFFD